jgi:hypothetical protein
MTEPREDEKPIGDPPTNIPDPNADDEEEDDPDPTEDEDDE